MQIKLGGLLSRCWPFACQYSVSHVQCDRMRFATVWHTQNLGLDPFLTPVILSMHTIWTRSQRKRANSTKLTTKNLSFSLCQFETQQLKKSHANKSDTYMQDKQLYDCGYFASKCLFVIIRNLFRAVCLKTSSIKSRSIFRIGLVKRGKNATFSSKPSVLYCMRSTYHKFKTINVSFNLHSYFALFTHRK